jgi:hypothetical protein
LMRMTIRAPSEIETVEATRVSAVNLIGGAQEMPVRSGLAQCCGIFENR